MAHREHRMEKLDVHSRTELIGFALMRLQDSRRTNSAGVTASIGAFA